ncbi:MAG: hypothetical protein RLZZ511_2843 [Cyanobacteriota bacterium]|jgi:hypothetical protein
MAGGDHSIVLSDTRIVLRTLIRALLGCLPQ